MASDITGTFTVVIRNGSAVVAFRLGMELVREALKNAPENEDLKQAIELFTIAARSMKVEA